MHSRIRRLTLSGTEYNQVHRIHQAERRSHYHSLTGIGQSLSYQTVVENAPCPLSIQQTYRTLSEFKPGGKTFCSPRLRSVK